ncbi:MAG: TolC family protein [Magnetococcales bacterium]|nr:TolC family protein [Magnetococcales bacterium]
MFSGLWLVAAPTPLAFAQGEGVAAQIFWNAVDNAQARSPILQRQAAALRAARETDAQSLSKLLPTVNVQASKTVDDFSRYHKRSSNTSTESHNEPSQVGVVVTQPIFNYVNLLSREQTIPHIDAAVGDLEFARQELVVRTATLASNWLEAKEVYELSARYTQVTAHHARIVGLRFKAGESTETEVHEAESRAAQAEASQANARNVMDKAAAAFAEVVGEPPAAKLRLPEFSWQEPPQFEARLAEFVEGRADIRAARARMEESGITTKMRRAEHAPSLRFTYSATHTWDSELGGSSGPSNKQDVDNQSSMLLLDIPVFNGGMVVSRTRQAQAEWEGRVADVDRLRLLAVREAQEARLDMLNLQLSIQAQTKALRYSQKALDGLQDSFLAGTRTILDLLDAQYEVLTIQTNLVRNRYQHRLARLRLWAAVGWPLVPERAQTIVATTDNPKPSVAKRGNVQAASSAVAASAQPDVDHTFTLTRDIEEIPVKPYLPGPAVAVGDGESKAHETTTMVAETAVQPVEVVDPAVEAAVGSAIATPLTEGAVEPGKALVQESDIEARAVGATVPAMHEPANQWAVSLPGDAVLWAAGMSQPVLPEAGGRPELTLTPAQSGMVGDRGVLVLQESGDTMPKTGWGPYYVCVGIYPNEAAMRPVAHRLTAEGIASVVESARLRDNRLVLRMLVGPFADFTDLTQARKRVDALTSRASGWIRNAAWTPVASPQSDAAGAADSAAMASQADAVKAADSAAASAVLASSGPFYAEPADIPVLSPAPQGPLYPHVSEPPFYVHAGAFATEEAREAARQQLRSIKIPTVIGARKAGSQRDTLLSPEGVAVHRLLVGPFKSYEESLQAKRAIQRETALLTGSAEDPRWEEHQGCPDENALQAEMERGEDGFVETHAIEWRAQ